jgi:hypothetical protein
MPATEVEFEYSVFGRDDSPAAEGHSSQLIVGYQPFPVSSVRGLPR